MGDKVSLSNDELIKGCGRYSEMGSRIQRETRITIDGQLGRRKNDMGEYFVWINEGKRQYLDQDACDDCGSIFSIATQQRCELTEAACSLINGPWRGDPVIFAGDYLSFGDGELQSHNEVLADVFGRHPYGNCYDGSYEEVDAPGSIIRYRYAINETKHEYVDRDATPLAAVYELPDGTLGWDRYDPVPVLLSPLWCDDPFHGRWCLDDVRMAHEQLGGDYKDISGCYHSYGECVLLTDKEISEIVYGEVFRKAIVEKGMRSEGDEIGLHGAVGEIACILKERQ